MKAILIIINDAPYGTEKAYNALRIMNSDKVLTF
jgi:sulfur relay (sulfurtransferase) complex TusBCD TusD component (DsrE family)